MAITPVHATKTVTTAGTRLQASTDTGVLPSSIYFEAAAANTGYIYVGLVTVSSTIYITRLAAGEGFSFDPDMEGATSDQNANFQLSDFYCDCSVSGEKYQLTYQGRKEK